MNREVVEFIIYIAYYKDEGVLLIETNLAQTVNATNDSGSVYDTNVKYLLADKQLNCKGESRLCVIG